MNPETRFSAHWIVAQQGMGKTNLLLHMLATDFAQDACVITLDAKGDLTNAVRHLSLGDRLLVLDPREPFAINPLDVSKTNITYAVDQLLYIFGALLDANVTPMQEAFLRPLLRALVIAHPKPTLATLQRIISSGPKGQFNELPPDLQEFFDVEWSDFAATRSQLKWRMRLLLENELIRNIFSASETKFHIGDAMDAGKIVVIDNSQAVIGKTGSSFLGRYFISQVWDAATARSHRKQQSKKPVYLYIDEAHLVINEKIASIIDECRSQRIALVLAHQRAKQVGDPAVLSALENCAVKTVNVDAEAHYFGKLLHVPEERINQLPIGHFAMHVRGEGSSIVEVPRASLPFRQMTASDEAVLRERMRSFYGSASPKTHKPPEADGSRELDRKPAEADKTILPLADSPSTDGSDSSSTW